MRLAMLDACGEAVGEETSHLVTRDTGRAVRAVLARELQSVPEGEVLTLDFAGVGIVDFSCADECLAKLVTRLTAGEFGEKYLVLTGLADSQRENIQVALERKRLCVLCAGPAGGWEALGTLTPHLRETLRLVASRPLLSARALAGLLNLELTTSSTRLGALHRQRLVRRREKRIGEGGREFVYESLPGAGVASGGAGD